MNTLDDIKDIGHAKRIDMILEYLIITKSDKYDEENPIYQNNIKWQHVYLLNKDKCDYTEELFGSAYQSAEYIGLITTSRQMYPYSKRDAWATNFGHYTYQNGGVEKHFLNREAERQLKINVDKAVRRSSNTSIVYAVITGVAIVFGTIVSYFNYKQSEKGLQYEKEQLDISKITLHKQIHDSLCPLLHYNGRTTKTKGEKYSTIDKISKKP
jgi:hypothetical protein